MEFIETSAKTAYNLQEAFELLTRDLINLSGKKKVGKKKISTILKNGDMIETEETKKKCCQ